MIEISNQFSVCAVQKNLSLRIGPALDVDVTSLHVEWKIS